MLVFVFAWLGQVVSTQPPAESLVWSTRAVCAAPNRVRITIAYREKAVYNGTVSLCRVRRASLPAEPDSTVRRFSFLGSPRDFAPARVESLRQITGRVWEATTGEESAMLGVAFLGNGEVLLNGTHEVSPTTPTRNSPVPSITISTAPVRTTAR